MAEQVRFAVPGVSCGHCKSAIEGALGPLEGVERADVDIDGKVVDVSFDPSRVGRDELVAAIADAGYEVA